MTKLLYFFPHSLMGNNSGCVRRAWGLLHYFKQKGFCVDLVYGTDFWQGPQTDKELDELKRAANFHEVYRIERKPSKKRLFSYLFNYKIHKIFKKKNARTIPNLVTPYTQLQFDEILRNTHYDYIIISYAYWANFVKNSIYLENTKTIIDTHDFLTSQEQERKGVDVGAAFEAEIERLNLFDEIWTVSSDEEYLFSQFCGNKVRLVPITFEVNNIHKLNRKSIDLIYVASDNAHNIRSANWFFEQVFPRLDPDVTLCVIGGIGKYVSDDARITKIAFAEDLKSYYMGARVAICPMLSGTGVKVKVLEALSFGLPVVCSSRGVDGLANKANNGCVIAVEAAEFVANIHLLLHSPSDYMLKQEEAIKYFQEHHERHVLDRILDNAFSPNTTPAA